MAKRFTDTGLMKQPWFRKLTPKLKCAVRHLFDDCDSAGVWVIDMEMMGYMIGEEITLDELLGAFNSDRENRIEKFGTDKIFIPGFISFQYGHLSESCKPHKPIIEKLKRYGLYERVLKGYTKGTKTLEEKEEDKEQETEMDFGKSENLLTAIAPAMIVQFKKTFPKYPIDQAKDLPSAFQIALKIGKELGMSEYDVVNTGQDKIKTRWGEIISIIAADKWFCTRSISDINNEWQRLIQLTSAKQNGTHKQSHTGRSKGNSEGADILASNPDLHQPITDTRR